MLSSTELLASKALFMVSSGFLISKIASRVFSKFYEFFMHRFGEHHYEIGERLEKPLSNIINLGVIYVLILESGIQPLIVYGTKALVILALLQVSFAVSSTIEPALKAYGKTFRGDRKLFMQLIPIIRDMTRILMLFAVAVASLLVFGVDVGPLIASAGLIGAAIAFATQNIISDFFYGIIMLFDGRIRPGDFVNVGSHSGKVIEVGVLSTKIETWDSTQLTIPNSVIGKEYLENLHLPLKLSKVKIKVGVSYDSDIRIVRDTLLKILRKHPKILDDPPPSVYFTDMLDSALEFTIIGYVEKPEDRFVTAAEIREMIISEFRKKGIDIPFPITTVYLRKGK